MKRSEGQRRFLISFRNQLAAEAVAALCLNDSLDSHSFPPFPLSFTLSLSSPSFCDVCLSLCVSFSCLLCCCCDGSAFISIKCKSQARIFPIERRFRPMRQQEGQGTGGGVACWTGCWSRCQRHGVAQSRGMFFTHRCVLFSGMRKAPLPSPSPSLPALPLFLLLLVSLRIYFFRLYNFYVEGFFMAISQRGRGISHFKSGLTILLQFFYATQAK